MRVGSGEMAYVHDTAPAAAEVKTRAASADPRRSSKVAQRQMAQSAKPTGRRDSKLGPLQVLSAKLGPVRTPMEAAKAAKESGLTVDAYLGGWTDDTRSGLGRPTTSAGEIYEGEWSGGRRHGRGLVLLSEWAVLCGRVGRRRAARHGVAHDEAEVKSCLSVWRVCACVGFMKRGRNVVCVH